MSSAATTIGARPNYVPPHLEGKVFDFRNEDDGTVSFYHPEAALGLGPEDSRVKLTRKQYDQTFDPSYRGLNFGESMSGQYAPLRRRPESGAQKLNKGIAGLLSNAFDWGTSSQGKAVGTAGLLAALLGGAGGYMWGRHTGSGKVSKSLLLALLAGGLGAAGTAWQQSRNNRRENYIQRMMQLKKSGSAMDISFELISAINNDITLSPNDKARIFRALARLEQRDRYELNNLIQRTVGAGAGVLVMRFLGAKGLLPMLAGGIVGAMLGGIERPRQSYNAMGQLSY